LTEGWRRNVRVYILAGSILLSALIYVGVKATVASGSLQTIRLTQIYALTSVAYLYVTLLAGPLTKLFTGLPFRGQYLKARRALGVSAFWFGLLHANMAFFGQLGGFGGLGFLSRRYLIAISLSATALLILFMMTATASDAAVEKLGFKNWKRLHRLVYLAGILILIHAAMLGTHFADLAAVIPRLLLAAVVVLMSLHAIGLYRKWTLASEANTPKAVLTVLAAGLVTGGLAYYVGLQSGTGSGGLGIHTQHATQPQPDQGSQPASNKSYSARMHTQGMLRPGQDATLEFTIYEAGSGEPVSNFLEISERLSHLVIVDNQLKYFQHIHPELAGSVFRVTAAFPRAGTYRLYLSYQPQGGEEQEVAFRVDIDSPNLVAPDTTDFSAVKAANGYSVSLAETKYRAKDFKLGKKALVFTANDPTGRPVTNLKPYLGAFGHLVMINQQTYEYLHVHPGTSPGSPEADGGPTVEFYPSSLTGEIKPGVYRLFLELNPDGQLIEVDFAIEVLD
jgi:DMSO/TMAO reductase YedYZ heme-binding membrane subunit